MKTLFLAAEKNSKKVKWIHKLRTSPAKSHLIYEWFQAIDKTARELQLKTPI